MIDLVALVNELGRPTVVVVGDLMLDRYVFGRVARISPEAPIQVLRVQREEERPGGAASVAANLHALGADVRVIGFTGEDGAGRRLRQLLAEDDVDVRGLVAVAGRSTTLKTRMVAGRAAGHQQILRVDREDDGPFDTDAEDRLLAACTAELEGAHCVVLSDYAKGVLSPRVTARIIELARERELPVVVDPKGLEYGKYQGATVVTPNRKEAREATGIELTGREAISDACRDLLDLAGVEAVVITLDKDGMALVDRQGQERVVPTTPREVYDVSGAGDVVTAVLGLALGDGRSLFEAVLLANVAAGVECGKVGAVPVTRDEVLQALGAVPEALHSVLTIDELLHALEPIRRAGREIVFTNGCFDILHAGHVRYLQAARRLGQVLVVGLNDDASVKRLKGPERPLNAQDDRAELLASLSCVDFVVLFGEDTPYELISQVRPDVLVKGEDWRDKGVVGSEIVEGAGGRVVLVPMLEGRSTTGLVDKIRANDDAESEDAAG
jgi:D-beta-D-heptose 7-phosphate kinase/D-beta-D-heptose 1-phosphate adenosyltransferase